MARPAMHRTKRDECIYVDLGAVPIDQPSAPNDAPGSDMSSTSAATPVVTSQSRQNDVSPADGNVIDDSSDDDDSVVFVRERPALHDSVMAKRSASRSPQKQSDDDAAAATNRLKSSIAEPIAGREFSQAPVVPQNVGSSIVGHVVQLQACSVCYEALSPLRAVDGAALRVIFQRCWNESLD